MVLISKPGETVSSKNSLTNSLSLVRQLNKLVRAYEQNPSPKTLGSLIKFVSGKLNKKLEMDNIAREVFAILRHQGDIKSLKDFFIKLSKIEQIEDEESKNKLLDDLIYSIAVARNTDLKSNKVKVTETKKGFEVPPPREVGTSETTVSKATEEIAKPVSTTKTETSPPPQKHLSPSQIFANIVEYVLGEVDLTENKVIDYIKEQFADNEIELYSKKFDQTLVIFLEEVNKMKSDVDISQDGGFQEKLNLNTSSSAIENLIQEETGLEYAGKKIKSLGSKILDNLIGFIAGVIATQVIGSFYDPAEDKSKNKPQLNPKQKITEQMHKQPRVKKEINSDKQNIIKGAIKGLQKESKAAKK